MYERFRGEAHKAMQDANQHCRRFKHEYIGTEHILLGMIDNPDSRGTRIIRKFVPDLSAITTKIEQICRVGPEMVRLEKLPETPRAKKAIEFAMEEARGLEHDYVGSEHLLLGLLHPNNESVAELVLGEFGMKLKYVRALFRMGDRLPLITMLHDGVYAFRPRCDPPGIDDLMAVSEAATLMARQMNLSSITVMGTEKK
jgi:ATP-dependent Clp protease ATP-binding subunit ClpA